MDTIRISGRVYPERPPSLSGSGDRKRRMQLIVSSLTYASESCTEVERKLYKSILEVRAHAENLLASMSEEVLPTPELFDLRSAEHEP